MADALERLEPAALDLIEETMACRLELARAARLPGAPARMSLTIRERSCPDDAGCVLTDRQIAARKRRQHG
jgi:hypothetical protein